MIRGVELKLEREALAYLLSAFFVALGWAASRYVDQVSSSPIIEYRVTEVASGGVSTVTVHLANLTRSVAFTGLTLVLRLEDGAFEEESLTLRAREPAWEGLDAPTVEGQSAVFRFPELHPGWRFMLQAKYTGSARRPTLQIQGSDVPVRFEERTFMTRFLRYEHWFIALVLLVWLAIVLQVALKDRKNFSAKGAKSARGSR